MRHLPGTGLYADRFRFLGAVANEVPQCLADLAGLLTPPRVALLCSMPHGCDELLSRQVVDVALPEEPWSWNEVGLPAPPEVRDLNAAVTTWASKWNLARDGAGGWVLACVGLTLYRWATRGTLLSRRTFEFPPHTNYLPPVERVRPFTDAADHLARAKRKAGAAVQLLTSVSRWHLAAFARWQVGGEGVDRVAKRWTDLARLKVSPDRKTVTAKMRSLASTLDLPARPNAPPGRPRGDR